MRNTHFQILIGVYFRLPPTYYAHFRNPVGFDLRLPAVRTEEEHHWRKSCGEDTAPQYHGPTCYVHAVCILALVSSILGPIVVNSAPRNATNSFERVRFCTWLVVYAFTGLLPPEMVPTPHQANTFDCCS